MALPLTWMADELRTAGLDPVEHSGWKTRSDPRNVYTAELQPVGVIDHHTAGSSILTNYPAPPYWTDSRLEAVCNITIRPDGGLSVLNAGVAYDSGSGSRKVYDAVRQDKPLPPLAGLESDMNGTLYFIDIEVQHRGDGGPIDPRQYDTLIRTNAVLCGHYGWNPMYRLIGHREWAPDRKPDPRWNGTGNPMPQIRTDTLQAMTGDDVKPPSWATAATQWHIDQAIYTEKSVDDVDESVEFHRQSVFRHRMYQKVIAPLEKPSGGLTEAQVKAIINGSSIVAP